MFRFSVHTALYVLSPQLHAAILTLVCGVFPFAPVHHWKVNHTLVGCANVIGNCVILYVDGLFAALVQPFKLYVIVFIFSVAVGEYVYSVVILFHVCGLLELLHVSAHV